MRYIIMCGGNYKAWETPRHLTEILGETVVQRTIRLLRENGITDISISANNPIFEQFGVPILHHENSYDYDNYGGKWYDCFHLMDEPVCYIFGDVVFSPQAMKIVVETETTDIELFGSTPPFADNYIKDHIEAFALKVQNTEHLKQALERTKQLEAENKFWRKPLIWELWTVIKDVPLQTKPDEYIYNYTSINDYTCDIDRKGDINKILLKIGGIKMVKVEALENFTLGRFGELQNIKRAGKDQKGWINAKDQFECPQDLADYLTGNNPLKRPVVKVLEIIPEQKDKEVYQQENIIKRKKTKKKNKKVVE